MMKDRIKNYPRGSLHLGIDAAKEAWGEDAGWRVSKVAGDGAWAGVCEGDLAGDGHHWKKQCNLLVLELASQQKEKEALCQKCARLQEQVHELTVGVAKRDKELSEARTEMRRLQAGTAEDRRWKCHFIFP